MNASNETDEISSNGELMTVILIIITDTDDY